MTVRSILFSGLAFWLVAQAASAQTPNPLVGAWERTSFIDATGKTAPPQPGFFVFTADGHFVQSVVPANRPKSDKPAQNMTPEELMARYQGVDFRLGTYSEAGGKVTFHDIANINPANEGREQSRLFRIDHDTLIVTAEGQKGELRYRRMGPAR